MKDLTLFDIIMIAVATYLIYGLIGWRALCKAFDKRKGVE